MNNEEVQSNYRLSRYSPDFLIVKSSIGNQDQEYGSLLQNLWLIFPEVKNKNCLIEIFSDGSSNKIHSDPKIVLETRGQFFSENSVGKEMQIDLPDIKDISWDHHELGYSSKSKKILIAKWGDYWLIKYDFRLNKIKTKELLKRAREFESACKSELDSENLRPHVLVYILWSCGELIMDAHFTLSALSIRKNHEDRKNELDEGRLGHAVLSNDFIRNFRQLAEWKDGARYGSIDLSKKATAKVLSEMLGVIEKELENKEFDL